VLPVDANSVHACLLIVGTDDEIISLEGRQGNACNDLTLRLSLILNLTVKVENFDLRIKAHSDERECA
jgi:hypothetical protein